MKALDALGDPKPWDDLNPRFHLFLGSERRYWLERYAESRGLSVATIIHALIDDVDWAKRIKEER